MSLRNDLQRGMREMEKRMGKDGETPQTININDVDYDCVPSSLGTEIKIDSEGNPVRIDLTVFIRRENFLTVDPAILAADPQMQDLEDTSSFPVSGDDAIFRGRNMTVVDVAEDGPLSGFRITLVDRNAKA